MSFPLAPSIIASAAAIALATGCGGSVDAIGQTGPADGSCATPSCAEPDGGGDEPAPDSPSIDASDAPDVEDAPDAADEPDVVLDSPAEGGSVCDIPDGGICDAVAKCGCPSGYTCSGGTGCRLYGSLGPYEHCDTLDPKQCGFGLVCSAGGVCVPYCRSSADCAGLDPFRQCGAVGWYGEYGICGRECDPADPGGSGPTFWPCGADLHCTPYPNGITDCGDFPYFGAPLPLGAPCKFTDECEVDAACALPPGTDADAGAAKACLRWCHADGTGVPCAPPSTCVPMGRSAGATPLGYCVAP